LKKFDGTLRNHEHFLMNYFKADKLYSIGIVEGLNLRIKLCIKKPTATAVSSWAQSGHRGCALQFRHGPR
jgi:hypothetical protein